jgi:hypothetical protein
MLSGMATEFKVSLLEARNTLGTIIMVAAYGDGRFVIHRYGRTLGAVVGIAELEELRDFQEAKEAAKKSQRPKGEEPPPVASPPPDPLDVLRVKYQRGEVLPWPRTRGEWEVHWRLAAEIGEKLIEPEPED